MVFSRLSEFQKDLLGDNDKDCSLECRTMQLGALTRLLNSTSLLHHSLEKDYQALSVRQLLEKVRAAVCPVWYSGPRHSEHRCLTPPGNAFDNKVKSIANEVDEASRGLSITDYTQSASESK
jgi:hypothetical protein